MAFTTTYIGSKSGRFFTTFNTDYSVGQVGSNALVDVMLVQALLKIFYYEMMGFNHGWDEPPGQTAVIVVDGLKGPITQKHITHFQRQAFARGGKIVCDGIFDPFRVPEAASTITKSEYALTKLNDVCAVVCEEQGADNYSNLPNREDIPVELQSALKRSKDIADKYARKASR